MPATILLVSLATFASTMLGGLFALRLRDRLRLILGFSSGAVIGVALFDLLPESIALAGSRFSVQTTLGVLGAGLPALHAAGPGHRDARALGLRSGAHATARRARVQVLSVHSLLDGLSIGLAFQVSTSVGAVVAIAVLVHDFSDGINTVGLILKNRGGDRAAFRWLLVDAAAPILGAA